MRFRSLYFEIQDYQRNVDYRGYRPFLEKWTSNHPDHVEWARSFAERKGDPIPPATTEDLFDLYSLSRVNQILLGGVIQKIVGSPDSPVQPKNQYRASEVPITLDEYLQFFTSLGFSVVNETTFKPFLHEIFAVEQSDEDTKPIELIGAYWPTLMLGPLVFSRGGGYVAGGRSVIQKEIAEHSCLYWEYHRPHRACSDLSHGWGSNSQWGTCFRRDYIIGSQAFLNVDAFERERYGEPMPEDEQAIIPDILKHRCMLVEPGLAGDHCSPFDDLWPFDESAIFEV